MLKLYKHTAALEVAMSVRADLCCLELILGIAQFVLESLVADLYRYYILLYSLESYTCPKLLHELCEQTSTKYKY